MRQGMSIRTYIRCWDVDYGLIEQVIKEGIFVPHEDGSIDVEQPTTHGLGGTGSRSGTRWRGSIGK